MTISTWLTQQANCFISGSTRRLHFGANCWQSDCLSVLLTLFYFWKCLSCCCNFWSIKLYNNPTSCSQQMREKRFKWKFFSRVVTGESLQELCAILIWYTNDLAKRHIFFTKVLHKPKTWGHARMLHIMSENFKQKTQWQTTSGSQRLLLFVEVKLMNWPKVNLAQYVT